MSSEHQIQTTKAETVIEAARSYLGARFHHQGRHPMAMDCIGLIVLAHRAAGYEITDCTTYSRQPCAKELMHYIGLNFEKQDGLMLPGDIALFQYRKRGPQHVAIFTENLGLIHTWADVGHVVENDYDHRWHRIFHSHWRVKEDLWRP